MEQREFAVEAEDAGQRIDRFLAGEDTGLSRSALQNLIAEGRVLANGQPAAKNRKLKAGDPHRGGGPGYPAGHRL